MRPSEDAAIAELVALAPIEWLRGLAAVLADARRKGRAGRDDFARTLRFELTLDAEGRTRGGSVPRWYGHDAGVD